VLSPSPATHLSEGSDWRLPLADRFERDLGRHVIEPWFPRCIDRAGGGFHQQFDRRWRRGDGEPRMLEFQARQTRTAARLAAAYPNEPLLAEAARHGFEYLARVMRDEQLGGWFWLVERDGTPRYGATKHAHGLSYAVEAFAEFYRLTGDPEALACARAAVGWIEEHHHDDSHGGYLGWVTREGKPILEPGDVPAGVPASEPLGHAVGLKDINVQSDMLSAYTVLAELDPDPLLAERVDELYDIIGRRMLQPDGSLAYAATPDWTSVAGAERFGYAFQQPARLLAAGALIGRRRADTLAIAESMVERAVSRSWDGRRGGGMRYATPRPGDESDVPPGQAAERVWWIQTEALRSLVMLSLISERPEPHLRWLERVVGFVDDQLLDHRFGGWHEVPLATLPLRQRLRGGRPKANRWKDASHEADMYLETVRALRGLDANAPLSASASRVS
jgi:cellobiose epimerase